MSITHLGILNSSKSEKFPLLREYLFKNLPHRSRAKLQIWYHQTKLRNHNLFARVDDIPTGDLALLHELEDFLELAKTDDLVGSLDETSSEEVDGFRGVLSVSNVAALDGDHADDCVEDGCLQEGVSG